MESRPLRILALIGDRPLPAVTGVNVRNLHLWTQIARKADVELKVLGLDLAPNRFAEPASFPGVNAEFHQLGRAAPWSRIASRYTQSWHEYPRSEALARRVDEMAETWRPDVIHAEEMRMAAYLPGLRGKTTRANQTITFHNVESDLFARLVHPSVPVGRALAARLQVASLRRLEARAASVADLPLAYSPADRERYVSLYPDAPWGVTRNGTDVLGIAPAPMPEAPTALILARWSYGPNREGLSWFLDRVRPLLNSDIRVTVAGSAADEALRAQVAAAGYPFVDTPIDLAPLYAGAAVVAVPVLEGSGTRGKILEALAYRRPVVTTTKGVEGLPLGPGEGVTIADDPESFALALSNVLAETAAARSEAAGRGREAVRECFDWSVVAGELVEAWRACVSP